MQLRSMSRDSQDHLIAKFESTMTHAVKLTFASVSQIALTAAGPAPSGNAKHTATKMAAGYIAMDTLGGLAPTWNKHVSDDLMPMLYVGFVTAAQTLTRQLGQPEDILPKPDPEKFLDGIRVDVARFSTDMWKTARTQVELALNDGADSEHVAQVIEESFRLKEALARNVAHTSMIAAINLGEHFQMQSLAAGLGATVTKTWEATDDERVRPTHHEADGQSVDISARYEVGEALLRCPGDPDGPPGETMNCRCSQLFDIVFADETPAPSQRGDLALAAAGFVESDHPRGHDGKFIKVGGAVISAITTAVHDLSEADKHDFVQQVGQITQADWDNIKPHDQNAISDAASKLLDEGHTGTAKAVNHLSDLENGEGPTHKGGTLSEAQHHALNAIQTSNPHALKNYVLAEGKTHDGEKYIVRKSDDGYTLKVAGEKTKAISHDELIDFVKTRDDGNIKASQFIAYGAPKTPANHLEHVKELLGGKSATAKMKVAAYDKLTQEDYAQLTPTEKLKLHNDLHQAAQKFLDPAKQQAALDVSKKLTEGALTKPDTTPTTDLPNSPSAHVPPAHVDEAKPITSFTPIHMTHKYIAESNSAPAGTVVAITEDGKTSIMRTTAGYAVVTSKPQGGVKIVDVPKSKLYAHLAKNHPNQHWMKPGTPSSKNKHAPSAKDNPNLFPGKSSLDQKLDDAFGPVGSPAGGNTPLDGGPSVATTMSDAAKKANTPKEDLLAKFEVGKGGIGPATGKVDWNFVADHPWYRNQEILKSNDGKFTVKFKGRVKGQPTFVVTGKSGTTSAYTQEEVRNGALDELISGSDNVSDGWKSITSKIDMSKVSSVSHLSQAQKKSFFDAAKTHKISPSSSGTKIFNALHAAKDDHKNDPDIQALTVGQMLDVLDQFQKHRLATPYKTQMSKWLKTSAAYKAVKGLYQTEQHSGPVNLPDAAPLVTKGEKLTSDTASALFALDHGKGTHVAVYNGSYGQTVNIVAGGDGKLYLLEPNEILSPGHSLDMDAASLTKLAAHGSLTAGTDFYPAMHPATTPPEVSEDFYQKLLDDLTNLALPAGSKLSSQHLEAILTKGGKPGEKLVNAKFGSGVYATETPGEFKVGKPDKPDMLLDMSTSNLVSMAQAQESMGGDNGWTSAVDLTHDDLKSLNISTPTIAPSTLAPSHTPAPKAPSPVSATPSGTSVPGMPSLAPPADAKNWKVVNGVSLGEASLEDESAPALQQIYTDFKAKGATAYLSANPTEIFQAAKKVADKQGISVGKVLAAVDHGNALKYGTSGDPVADNNHAFADKIDTWLNTGNGPQIAKDIYAGTYAPPKPKKKNVYDSTEDVPAEHPFGQKVPIASHSVPAFDSSKTAADFPVLSTSKAASLWSEMETQHGAVKPTEKSALRWYTTNEGYHSMNGYLRGEFGASTSTAKKTIKAQQGMRPSTQDLVLHRGAGYFSGWDDAETIQGHVGKVWQEPAFFSASVGGHAAFGGGIQYEIQVPKGTPMAYVKSFSHYGGENEMLLAAGLKYQVVSASPSGYGTKVVLRVVPIDTDSFNLVAAGFSFTMELAA